MCGLEMAYYISYAPGQPRKLGVGAWHERNENEVFLALAWACVRELLRTRDTGLDM